MRAFSLSTVLATLLPALVLGGCSEPAPLADDRWPGFDPDAASPILFDMASLTLHLSSDRRDTPGRIELTLADGTQTQVELPSRIANDDVIPLGLYAPGEAQVRVVLGAGDQVRSLERRVLLESRRHHGLAFDLRTPTEEPSRLRVDLGPIAASMVLSEGQLIEPQVRLYELDEVLEARRTVGSDPDGRELEAELTPDGHVWLVADGLRRGEHVLRAEPGGIERLLWLAEGDNVVELGPNPTLAQLEIEVVDAASGEAPSELIAHWTAPVDGDREPTVVAPNALTVGDGRLRIAAPPGTVHLLVSGRGIGTRFKSFELPPEGLRGRLQL